MPGRTVPTAAEGDKAAKADKAYLVKGSLINGLGLATRVVSPFLVILVARYYPPEDFGLFASLQALVLTLSRIAVLGLDKGMLWFVPRTLRRSDGDGARGLGLADSLAVSSVMGALILAGFAAAAAMGWLGRFGDLGRGTPGFTLAMIASVIPFTAMQLFSSALEGKRLPQYRVVITSFLGAALVPALAFATRPWLGNRMSLAAGMLLGNLAACLCFLPALWRHFPAEPWLRPRRPAPELLRYALPLAASELIASVLLRVDLWMILILLGPAKAAVYAVMVTITNGLRTVRQTFEPLLVPIVSNLTGEELRVRLKATFSYATNLVSTLQLSLACFILVFPREILSLAGKAYVVEIFAFALLMMGNLANGFLGLNGGVMLGMGKSRLMLAISASGLLLNLAGDWLLIPRMGVSGAALMSCVVLLYQNSLHWAYVRFGAGLDLYERHLYLNAALEIGILGAFFAGYRTIEALALPARIGLFAVLAAGFGFIAFLKRKSFVHR